LYKYISRFYINIYIISNIYNIYLGDDGFEE